MPVATSGRLTTVNLSTRAVATAAAAAAIAGGAYLGPWALLVVLAAFVVLLAFGWAPLLGLPVPGGTFFVVLLPGLGALAVAHATDTEPWMRYLPLVVAMGVLLAFVNELLRGDGRERLVDSLTGGVAGLVVAVSAAGWVSANKLSDGTALVVLCAVSLAVASGLSATRLPQVLRSTLVVIGAIGAGAGVAYALPEIDLAGGLWTGATSGVLIAALGLLFHRLPELRQPRAATAVIVLPVAVGGMLAYIIGQLLIG